MDSADNTEKLEFYSLLDKSGYQVILASLFLFITIQTLLINYIAAFHNTTNNNVSPDLLANDKTMSLTNYFCMVAFFTSIFVLYPRHSSRNNEIFKDIVYSKSFYICSTINFIAGVSEWSTFMNDHNVILQNSYGTHSVPSQWPEWIVSVPLIVYFSCAIESNKQLPFTDKLLLLAITLALSFGALSYYANDTRFVSELSLIYSYRYYYLPLGILYYGISLLIAIVLPRLNNINNNEVDLTKATLSPEELAINKIKVLQSKSRKKLLDSLFFTMFNYFPIVTLLEYCGTITVKQALMATSLGSLGVKLMYCAFLTNEHMLLQDYYIKEMEIISKMKSMERELRGMIANVAHDLKTPLSGIYSGVQYIETIFTEISNKLIEFDNAGTASRKTNFIKEYIVKNIDGILTSTKQISSIHMFMVMAINRCLDTTKSSKGLRLVPKKETFSLRQAVQLVLTCMESVVPDSVTILPFKLSSNINNNIISDRQWLIENLLCLLSNASKYSESGNIEVKMKLINTAGGSRYLRFEVHDHGIGIDEETMSSLFNPFKQAQKMAGGTGLGLYSLAKRIDALGGEYGVRNREDRDRGSVFWFTIPYRPDKSLTVDLTDSKSSELYCNTPTNRYNSDSNNTTPTVTPTNAITRTPTNDATISKGKVLLVDDSITVRKMCRNILEKANYTVTLAKNGAQAVDIIETLLTNDRDNNDSSKLPYFDVVLMDFQMPVMDGLEATKRIRQLESTFNSSGKSRNTIHHVIIGSSANSDEETSQQAKQIGIDCIMGKPFDIQYFETLLENNYSK